jgi:hyaluronan synthase
MTLMTLGGRYHNPGIALVYLAVYLVVRFGQSGLYILMRPDMTARQRWHSWLVGTPAAVFMNIVLLCPTRYWALFKLRDNAWQSRGLTAKTALPGGRHRAPAEKLLKV